jgi:hypothetical protein
MGVFYIIKLLGNKFLKMSQISDALIFLFYEYHKIHVIRKVSILASAVFNIFFSDSDLKFY